MNWQRVVSRGIQVADQTFRKIKDQLRSDMNQFICSNFESPILGLYDLSLPRDTLSALCNFTVPILAISQNILNEYMTKIFFFLFSARFFDKTASA